MIGLVWLSICASARAAPCDDASDAWTVIDAGIHAEQQGDPRAVERAVSALTENRCTPAGAHRDWIARARLEARLLVLEARVRAAGSGLSHMPRQTGRSGPTYLLWIRRAIAPWITTQMAAVRAVMRDGSTLAADATGEPGIAAEALAAVIGLELELATAVEHVPMSDDLRRDPELARTYRSLVQDNTRTLVDSVREGHRALVALARREAILPRAARRVEAMLLLRGRITADERTGARHASTPSAVPMDRTPPRAVVEAGRPQADVTVPARALRDVVGTATPALRACYEHGLDDDRTLHGDVTLRVSLGAAPGATQVQVSHADAVLRSVGSCMAEALRRLPFPAVTAAVSVDFPFHLEPGMPEPNTTVP